MKIVIGGDISIKAEKATKAFAAKETKALFDKGMLDLFRSATSTRSNNFIKN